MNNAPELSSEQMDELARRIVAQTSENNNGDEITAMTKAGITVGMLAETVRYGLMSVPGMQCIGDGMANFTDGYRVGVLTKREAIKAREEAARAEAEAVAARVQPSPS